MEKLIIIVINFLIVGTLLGQVTNDDIDYYVEVDGVDWDADVGSLDNTPEAVWRVRSRENSEYSNSCNIDDYSGALCLQRSSYAYTTGLGKQLKSRRDAAYETKIYYNVFAFEKDGDNNCDHDGNDDFEHCGRGTISFTSHPVGEYHTYGWHNIQGKGWSDIRMRQFWSYSNGQWGNPLKFGSISKNQTKSHTNHSGSNRSGYGYSSTFNFPGIQNQLSPDVAYEFTVSEGPLLVNIGISETTFDGNIYLLKKNGSTFDLITTDLDERSPSISSVLETGTYNVVFEGQDFSSLFGPVGLSGEFKITIEGISPVLTAGAIDIQTPNVKDGCTITKPIKNTTSATTTYDEFNYTWYKKIMDTNPQWELINGAISESLTADELGTLSDNSVYVRRHATQLGEEAITDSVLITVRTIGNAGYNGVIKGKVTGPGGIGNIAGASIYAVSDAEGECAGHIDSTLTNSSGGYTLPNLYYGNNGVSTNFKVYARFLDHEFQQPDTLEVEIASNASQEDQNFIDITSIYIKGRLYQVDQDQDTCGIVGNGFFLNEIDQIPTVTDEIGNYNLVIAQRASDNRYDVRPDTTKYQFSPPSINEIFVIEDVVDIDFENTRIDTIRGTVTACGGFYFGQVSLKIEDLNGGCFTYYKQTDLNGAFKIAVPARKYAVEIDDVISTVSPYTKEEILQYFENVVDTVDVTKEEASVNFIYRQPPSISITGLPINTCDDKMDTVFYQGVPTTLIFDITEVNTGGCPMDTGVLIISDDISGIAGTIEIPFSQGRAEYTIVPGEPFIFGDYKKSFSVLARDIERPANMAQVDFRAIVDGNKPRESTFTTVSPDIPILILRDPPGDRSFSTYSKDTSTQIVTSFSKQIGGGLSTWSKTKAGTKNGAGIGFTTEFEANVNTEKEFSINAKNASQNEMITEVSANITYNTSNEDDGIGTDADLFVGGAFNIRYALTDLVIYNTATCDVETDTDMIMGLDSLVTEFSAASKDIENTIIPSLEELADIADDDAGKRRFENQVNIWQQMLDRRDALNDQAIEETDNPTNRTITGTAGPLSYQASSSSTNSTFYEVLLEVERSVALGAKLEVAGSGKEGKVQVNFRFEAGKSETTVTTTKTTVGYTLDDDDSADFYEVQIYNDPVYQTPVFVSESPTTSCPYTGGRKVDNPVLTVTPAIQSNVPAQGQAEYTFTVTNGTELPPTSDYAVRSYILDIDNASNPHGAVIVVGGDGNFPLEFDNIGRGASLDRDLAVTRVGAPNQSIYTYEGLKFELQPVCETLSDSIFTESTREVSAYFTSDCSGITLASPAPGWIYSSASGNVLSVHLTEYDKTKLSTVTLQYSKKGINQWTDDAVLTPDDLNNNSTEGEFIDWIVPDDIEGEYEIRLKLNCINGVIYSLRSEGLIDRMPPMLYGLPAPIDDVYDITQNDEISISYTEDIACANVNTQLLDALTDVPIAHTSSCSGNTLQIVPNHVLAPSAYRVIVNGVEDDHQNTAQEYRWLFITEGFIYDPGCTPIEISNNNLNQDAISQTIYRSLQITSDGTVADGTTIDYRAEETIELTPGFSVNKGGSLEANIEACDN